LAGASLDLAWMIRRCPACGGALGRGEGAPGGCTCPEGRAANLVADTLRAGGAPLAPATRAFFEQRFGHPLGEVRVHTGDRADRSARAVDALAYTVGSDVAFRAGYFAPSTAPGQRLLAHELAHVVQQGRGGGRRLATVSAGELQVGRADDPLEREADRAAAAALSPGAAAVPALSADGAPAVRRGLGDWLGSAWDATGGRAVSAIGEGAAWVGEKTVAGARVVGGALVDAGEWAAGQVKDTLAAGRECIQAVGSSVTGLLTGSVSSLADLIGVPRPAGANPVDTLGLILGVLQHPCLRMIPGYSLVRGVIKFAQGAYRFLTGAWELIQNPEPVIAQIRETMGGLVAQVPEAARAAARKAITFSDPPPGHLEGIWRHLEPKLEYLRDHWWEVVKETAWQLIWPWDGFGTELGEAWDHVTGAASKLWDLDFSGATDELLALWRTVNNLLGRLYGWFFIASVLVGAIIGAFFGGAGAIPGAAAGAAFAGEVGEVLLLSVIAAELLSIGKAGFDLVFRTQTEEEQEADYEQIASSAMTLAITGVMFLLSELAARLARAILARVRGLVRARRTPTARERFAENKAAATERARVTEINEGIAKLDREIAAGRKTFSAEEMEFVNASPRNKELAYDPAAKTYRVDEARAALAAERQGSLPSPVRRATTAGDDFVDGSGRTWDHKGQPPGASVEAAANEIIRLAGTGENIIADLTTMNPAAQALVRQRVLARLPGLRGRVVFVPPGVSVPGVVGGVAGSTEGGNLEHQGAGQ
jgi:hypothetical protein